MGTGPRKLTTIQRVKWRIARRIAEDLEKNVWRIKNLVGVEKVTSVYLFRDEVTIDLEVENVKGGVRETSLVIKFVESKRE